MKAREFKDCWNKPTKPKRGRPESSEKAELLAFILKEYGIDAGRGFKARLSLADLRKLKAYADESVSNPCEKNMKWKSCAKWSPDVYKYNDCVSTDIHYTKEQAEAICRMLEKMGFGGDGVYFPLKTWVEPA